MTRTRAAAPPPARVRGTAKKSGRHQAADHPIVPAATETTKAMSAALREMMPGTFALVDVETSRPGAPERFRRKLFLTLPPAQRAVEDARARGQQATALLVELHPVGVLGGAL